MPKWLLALMLLAGCGTSPTLVPEQLFLVRFHPALNSEAMEENLAIGLPRNLQLLNYLNTKHQLDATVYGVCSGNYFFRTNSSDNSLKKIQQFPHVSSVKEITVTPADEFILVYSFEMDSPETKVPTTEYVGGLKVKERYPEDYMLVVETPGGITASQLQALRASQPKIIYIEANYPMKHAGK